MHRANRSRDIKSILIPLAFALLFSFWGCTIYFLAGENGPSTWFLKPRDTTVYSDVLRSGVQTSARPQTHRPVEAINIHHALTTIPAFDFSPP